MGKRLEELAARIRSGEFEAVLFDLDGTLIDSMWMWEAIDAEYLGRYGHAMPEGLQADLGGRSMAEMAVMFRERFGIPRTNEEMMAEWNEMAMEKYRREVPLKEGVPEFIDYLRARGIRMAVGTSNSRQLATAVLDHWKVRDVFDALVCGDEIPRGKPAPDTFLIAAEHLGVRPERCMVVEDVPYGIEAGKAAGAAAVLAVLDDHSPDSDKAQDMAEYAAISLRELVEALS